jgi:RNA polymerase sigma-70 factor (ECF subfamily)
MTKCIAMLVLMFVLITGVIAQKMVKITVKTMPPSVVKTVPQAGNMEVDPSLKEITVTFSKDMMTDKMWSWCSQTAENFPEINKDNIRYLKDKRTCVLPVKLQAGKTYVIWINSRNFKNFKDTENNSAVAYLLVFKTASKAALALRRSAEKSAASVAREWLALLDKGKYNKSWNDAAAYLKAKITEKQW